MSAEKIIADFKKKNVKPLYWLEGEEDYYIDLVMDYAEKNILTTDEIAGLISRQINYLNTSDIISLSTHQIQAINPFVIIGS